MGEFFLMGPIHLSQHYKLDSAVVEKIIIYEVIHISSFSRLLVIL